MTVISVECRIGEIGNFFIAQVSTILLKCSNIGCVKRIQKLNYNIVIIIIELLYIVISKYLS